MDNAAGIGFSNAAGVTNDVVLATGSLVSASLAVSPTGTRNAHYVTTLQPVDSEAGFFAGPGFAADLEEFLNSPLSTFQVTQLDPLTTLQVVGADGGSTRESPNSCLSRPPSRCLRLACSHWLTG